MCDLIDYPDGSTIDSIATLAERYPDGSKGVVFDGVSSIHRFLPLAKAAEWFGNQCLCNVDVETVLSEAGEKWAKTDFGYEVGTADDVNPEGIHD